MSIDNSNSTLIKIKNNSYNDKELLNQPKNLNYLSDTRAVIEIHELPELSFNATSFMVPGISTSSAQVPAPGGFVNLPLRGDKLRYAPLEITFLVTEDLENWNLAHDWMTGFTAPFESKQFEERKFDYSDASVFVYSSHHNLAMEITFKDLTPIYLGALRFNTTSENTVEVFADITFEYNYYTVNKLYERAQEDKIAIENWYKSRQ